ncbi:MAG TPA: antitoxin [Bacteroidota bacterium]|nr:antitoxin [Bacteroidota bacterium]
MATLQVRDVDDGLYDAIKRRAARERRSISQEIIIMIESFLRTAQTGSGEARIEEFTNLRWAGEETADELISHLKQKRMSSRRFGGRNDLFA